MRGARCRIYGRAGVDIDAVEAEAQDGGRGCKHAADLKALGRTAWAGAHHASHLCLSHPACSTASTALEATSQQRPIANNTDHATKAAE